MKSAPVLFSCFNQQWDKTNFLVDLSGNYANCDYINRQGFLDVVDRKMPDGRAIMAIIDSTYGEETHTNAVDGYIRPVMERWIQNNDYLAQVFQNACRLICVTSKQSVVDKS